MLTLTYAALVSPALGVGGLLYRARLRRNVTKLARPVRKVVHTALLAIAKVIAVTTVCPVVHLAQRLQPQQRAPLDVLERRFLKALGLLEEARDSTKIQVDSMEVIPDAAATKRLGAASSTSPARRSATPVTRQACEGSDLDEVVGADPVSAVGAATRTPPG